MASKPKILKLLFLICLSILTVGCSFSSNIDIKPIDSQYYPTATGTVTASPTPFQARTNTPIIVPPSSTPTSTDTPSPTSTPAPTDTPLPSDTPTMENIPAGHVTAPILLYHHVADDGYGNRYYVSVNTFRAQMEALRAWGYTAITVSELAEVLVNGGELPSKPVVITFDDGNLDVYQNAFPIMQGLGFVGTDYIVANRLQSNYFVDVEQIQEMASAGWEIGSHGMTHTDLTTDHPIANYEMRQSMLSLQEVTGETISTFAYPYGKMDEFISTKASEYGYRAGMGLGAGYQHYLSTLFYLSRMEIQGEYDMAKFASLLPWSGQ